jgi:hypothetical protein
MVVEPLLWSQRHEGTRDHSLKSRVGSMPTIGQELADGNKLQCGVNLNTHCLAKRTKDGCTESLVKPQGQGSMMTKTSRSALGWSNGDTSHLKSQRID